MDLKKIGKFIADRRKAKNWTQVQLACKIGVSEKTISKWECGNGFPDATLVLPLCQALEISANELLCGKILSNEEYKQNAEKNILLMKNRQEKIAKHFLTLEWVLGIMAISSFYILLLCAIFAINLLAWRIVAIVSGVIILLTGTFFTVKIEQIAGFYKCSICNHSYIPTYKSVFFSMHSGRTRYMKCPKCGKRSWQKKVISED